MPTIPLDCLHDDSRNANVCSSDTLEKIRRNIQRTGLYPLLIVRPYPDREGQYIILDGHHRKRILKELSHQQIECQVWDIDEREAQLALATLNRLRGEDAPRKRAELIQSLTQIVPLPDLVQCIPETQGQVEDLLALITLDWEETKAQIENHIELEEAELPVPFVCMVDKADYPDVERALNQATGSDQGQKFVFLCRYYLKGKANAQTG